jgi:hypothetical protein
MSALQPRSTRATGWWLILGGAAICALGFLLSLLAPKGLSLVGLGVAGVLIGFGWLYRPWSAEMIAANAGGTFGPLWRVMPLFWKLWFVVSILVGIAVIFASVLFW